MARLTAQVTTLTEGADAEPDEALAVAKPDACEEPADEDEWQYPPFILLLDPPPTTTNYAP
ncbi:hypothetical protein ACF09J_34950 [Streptomyces sp. NPDC014889]|uniref:hypothetical protein n=1 Tax=Streptomyces sp. NPDC014889 TaxID=3364928 RepID=UPI0036F53296